MSVLSRAILPKGWWWVTQSGGASSLRRLVGCAVALAVACMAMAGWQAASGPLPAWWRLAACAALAAAGWLLQMSVRLGSQRLIFAWGAAAASMALVLEPASWVVLTTAAGMVVATFAPAGRAMVKATYNSAVYTIGASAAAGVYAALGPVELRLHRWPDLAVILAAALAYIIVVDVGVQAVLGVVRQWPIRISYRADWRGRALHVAAELGVVLFAAAAAAVAPQLLFAVPVLAVGLQQGHRGAVAAAAERESARRVFGAIQAFSVETSEVAVAQRAAEQILALLTADAVEILLHGAADPPRHEAMIRATREATIYIGPPAGAPPVPGHVAALEQVGEDGLGPAELRVYFAAAVTLTERETAAVRTVVAALAAALGTARAHADLALMAARAAHEASHDHTTGLPARRLMLQRIGGRLEELTAAAEETPVAVMVLHISGWPDLLEACGAEVADQLLGHAAGQLQTATTLGELVGHLGGDTFAVFFTDAVSVHYAQDRARTILAVLSAPVLLDTGPVALSGAAGLAYATASTTTADDLLRRARVALRQAHRRGTDLEIYRPEDDVRGPAAIVLGSELRTGIDTGQLELHYQPVIDLTTGLPVAVEALPRWRHPNRGLLPATAWMDLLETSNLVPTYVRWLLSEALATWATWTAAGILAPVSVNLPGRALLDPALPGTVTTILVATDAPPTALTLELAESRALTRLEAIDRTLATLAAAKINLAIDDFGSARSSLARLRRVPATEIKLAPDYSHDLLTDPESRAIVGAVVGLADQLNLRVTAVDIPTRAHTTALARLGVHAGQGPCLYPPVHHARILTTLQAATANAAIPPSADIITLRPRRTRPST